MPMPGFIVDERSRPGRMGSNNFDSLRILAAVAVVFSHSFALSYGGEAKFQPLYDLSRGQTQLGSLAVLVFFVISGYLITWSFQRRPSAGRFLMARALRIYPALFVVLLLTATVLGPAITDRAASAYFSEPAVAWYIPNNISLFNMQFRLPGVFDQNPSRVVNGSLWTLQYEVMMYLVILVLGVSRLLRPVTVLVLWAIVILLEWKWIGGWTARFAAPFLGGSVLCLWRGRIPMDWRLAALSALAVGLSFYVGGLRMAFAIFGSYIVIFLATASSVRMPNLARYGDLSYGTYIFAFPIQQTVTSLSGGAPSWYWNVMVSLPLILVLSGLSWHFVERPALSLKPSGNRGNSIAEAASG